LPVWGLKGMGFPRVAGALLVAGFLVILSHGSRSAPAAGSPVADAAADAILPDHNIRFGVLPNGLRYAVMQNASPAGATSIRLGVETGSFDENDNERGLAHFLEHMAFSAGRNEHEAGPERAFADAGVTFGRDQNAETSTFATVFRLDLPKSDDASFDLAFNWLRKVGDGAIFPDDAVNRERAIILAERETDQTPERKSSEAAMAFFMPGLRSARPESIGTVKDIDAVTGTSLESFYSRWYRPDNAVLVVIGDQPADALEARIRQSFASWSGNGARPIQPTFGTPDETRSLEVMLESDPRLPPTLGACRVRHADLHGIGNVAELRRETLTKLWVRILDQRLSELSGSEASPFISGGSTSSRSDREAELTCIYASLRKGGWENGLRALSSEIRGFAASDPTQNELDDAIDAERANYRGAMRSEATRKSAELADEILNKELDGDVVASAAEMFRAFDVAVENVVPTDVSRAFAKDWSGSGPLIVVSDTNSPSADAVKAAWNRSQSERPQIVASAPAPAQWAYSDFGAAGHVANREQMHSPDFVRLTFDNGTILNFKQTNFEREMVHVRVGFGHGRRDYSSGEFVSARLGADLVQSGGLGHHSFEEIRRIFSQSSFDATLSIGDDGFTLKGSTMIGSVASQLQMLAAYVSDPGFRRSLDADIPTLVDSYYRQIRANPETVVTSAVGDALMPGGALSYPGEDKLAQLHMADFERLLKPQLTQDPLEVTIVGDIDETIATELVGATFGALPKRSPPQPAPTRAQYLRFPDGDLPALRTTHEGPQGEAYVAAFWPLYVASPTRRREEVALTLLTEIFNNELRHRIRQELGETYSPTVELNTPDEADQGYLEALVETSLPDADNIRTEILAMARRFAHGDISDDVIEAARAPLLARMKAETATNQWWVAYLNSSASLPSKLVEMIQVPQLTADVTPAEIRKAAADWLARVPLTVVATPAAEAGSK
jgi:zinc protease